MTAQSYLYIWKKSRTTTTFRLWFRPPGPLCPTPALLKLPILSSPHTTRDCFALTASADAFCAGPIPKASHRWPAVSSPHGALPSPAVHTVPAGGTAEARLRQEHRCGIQRWHPPQGESLHTLIGTHKPDFFGPILGSGGNTLIYRLHLPNSNQQSPVRAAETPSRQRPGHPLSGQLFLGHRWWPSVTRGLLIPEPAPFALGGPRMTGAPGPSWNQRP